MTRPLALPLLLVLAACGGGVVNEAMPQEPGPDAAACRQEAERDPEVQRIADSLVPTIPDNVYRVRQQLLVAIPRAYNECMIRRGARPAGGVERIRPAY